MKQYTRRTAQTAKAQPLRTPPETIAPSLPPEMVALAEVLAAYMQRANIRAVIVEPDHATEPAPVTP